MLHDFLKIEDLQFEMSLLTVHLPVQVIEIAVLGY